MDVEGCFGTELICPAIEDQYTVSVVKDPELEPAIGANEKGIVLGNMLWPCICQRRDNRNQGLEAGHAGFDFDIRRHESTKPRRYRRVPIRDCP